MVIISTDVENVLLDIHFKEFAYNVNTPNYYALKEKLFALDNSYANRIPGRYPAWQRIGWFEFVYKQHIFGYSWDGETVVLQEHYNLKGNKTESKTHKDNILKNNIIHINRKMNTNKKVVRLTESQLHSIITESVKSILNEIGDTPKGQYMLGGVNGRRSARNGYGDNFYDEDEIYDYASDSLNGYNSNEFNKGSIRAYDKTKYDEFPDKVGVSDNELKRLRKNANAAWKRGYNSTRNLHY